MLHLEPCPSACPACSFPLIMVLGSLDLPAPSIHLHFPSPLPGEWTPGGLPCCSQAPWHSHLRVGSAAALAVALRACLVPRPYQLGKRWQPCGWCHPLLGRLQHRRHLCLMPTRHNPDYPWAPQSLPLCRWGSCLPPGDEGGHCPGSEVLPRAVGPQAVPAPPRQSLGTGGGGWCAHT